MTHAEVLRSDDCNSIPYSYAERAPPDRLLSERFATRRNFGREAVPAMRYQAGRAEADGTAEDTAGGTPQSLFFRAGEGGNRWAGLDFCAVLAGVSVKPCAGSLERKQKFNGTAGEVCHFV